MAQDEPPKLSIEESADPPGYRLNVSQVLRDEDGTEQLVKATGFIASSVEKVFGYVVFCERRNAMLENLLRDIGCRE